MSYPRAYWISWYSPADRSTFELHSPWWVSGYAPDHNGAFSVDIIVAAVFANSVQEAELKITQAYDFPPEPAEIEWRFCDPITAAPFGGRFPMAEWMEWKEDGTSCRCGLPECDGVPK